MAPFYLFFICQLEKTIPYQRFLALSPRAPHVPLGILDVHVVPENGHIISIRKPPQDTIKKVVVHLPTQSSWLLMSQSSAFKSLCLPEYEWWDVGLMHNPAGEATITASPTTQWEKLTTPL